MPTLHVLSHSPFNDDRLDSCLRLLGSDDALLLCGDAVYALREGGDPQAKLIRANLSHRLFALEEDLKARAIDSPLMQSVDYQAFVELTLRFDKVNSWL